MRYVRRTIGEKSKIMIIQIQNEIVKVLNSFTEGKLRCEKLVQRKTQISDSHNSTQKCRNEFDRRTDVFFHGQKSTEPLRTRL